jgi:hypothetical protein
MAADPARGLVRFVDLVLGGVLVDFFGVGVDAAVSVAATVGAELGPILIENLEALATHPTSAGLQRGDDVADVLFDRPPASCRKKSSVPSSE